MVVAKEMALLNSFIIKVLGGSDVVKQVQDNLSHKAAHSPEVFTTGDWVEITGPDIAGALEAVLDTEYNLEKEEIPTIVYEFVYDNIDMGHLHGLEEAIRKRLKRIKQEAEKRQNHSFDF